jgi:hypothetical protein
MEAIISGRGLGIALAYFDAKQAGFKLMGEGAGKMRTKYLSRTTKAGRGPVYIPGVGWRTVSFGGDVDVKVKLSGGRKVVGPEAGFKPFLTKMKSGHIGVFVRSGSEFKSSKGRAPLKQLFGPGIGGLFGSAKIQQAVKKLVEDRFKVEFDHQLEHYLGLK